MRHWQGKCGLSQYVAKPLESLYTYWTCCFNVCRVEIVYPSTAAYSLLIDSADSHVQANFVTPVIVVTGKTSTGSTLSISSTAEVAVKGYATILQLTLIAPTSTLAIHGTNLALTVKGTTTGSVFGTSVSLLLEGNVTGDLFLSASTVAVSVNGGSCSEIAINGGGACDTTNALVEEPTLDCLVSAIAQSVRCNAEGSIDEGATASPVVPSPAAPSSPNVATSDSLRGRWHVTASALLVMARVVAW